jgi:hypothetical protein
MRSLIDCGTDLNAICTGLEMDRTVVRRTPLHVATYRKCRDIVILLLECSADTEARGSWDKTALYMALSHRCTDLVLQLIRHGADLRLNAQCKDIDHYDNDVKYVPPSVPILPSIYFSDRHGRIFLLLRGLSRHHRFSKVW